MDLLKGTSQNRLMNFFRRPLIMGASVSADYGTASPARRLARDFGVESHVRHVARAGKPGRDVWPLVSEELRKSATCVVALDFLFWDASLKDSRSSIATLREVFAAFSQVPLIFGDIPKIRFVGAQPSRDLIMAELEAGCRLHSNCAILRWSDHYERLMQDGYLNIEGRRATLREIMPDGLHPSPLAARFLEQELIACLMQAFAK